MGKTTRGTLLACLLTCAWVAACSGANPDPNDGGGGSGGSGGSAGGSGGGTGGGGTGGTGGGSGGAGGGSGGAGGGGSTNSDGGCATACDCSAGLGCFQGACIAGFAPVYCCVDTTTCPNGSICQYPTANYSRCGAGDGGFVTRDGGFVGRDSGFDYCPFIQCDGGTRCTNLGCSACGASGTCLK